MIFGRNKASRATTTTTHTPTGVVHGSLPLRPAPPRMEYVGITLAEMEEFERILLHSEECTRRSRPDLGYSSRNSDVIARLYQSAGAVSVVQPDPELARIPVRQGDFQWLEYAIRDIEMYRGDPQTACDGRTLLNRLNALLGQARAVIHMGGTPVFDPAAPELPAHHRETM
ncbi:hypothetical protein [Streptomyces sp. bgisy060]|uniref:hypothetical protein n=1 Tax=Streptomyces sp. bgisy060 TaxID=3413775 RepID=UPI003EBF0FAC